MAMKKPNYLEAKTWINIELRRKPGCLEVKIPPEDYFIKNVSTIDIYVDIHHNLDF